MSAGASTAASTGAEPPAPDVPPDENAPPEPLAPPFVEPPFWRTVFVVPPVDEPPFAPEEPPVAMTPPESAEPPLADAPPLFDESAEPPLDDVPPVPVWVDVWVPVSVFEDMRAFAHAPAPVASDSALAAKTSRRQVPSETGTRPGLGSDLARRRGISGPQTSVIP